MPNSEATISAGIMILGAFIAGVAASIRSSDPNAAGLRAGFIGGVLGLLTFISAAGLTPTGSLPRLVFVVFASGLVVCVAPLFGLGFGHIGGWIANAVISRLTTRAATI
ncbi:hypothetical protein GCM10009030_20190 [Haloarcula pellucida]|uniref:Uncharacterized protein n=1 Tax=Haloarcula pellucida TaxID=1427151 RepID=A0A830GLS9_9EURY|nr:hypothetical protein GCM10009030_20190 [Halomicroarcula pellucida]